VTAYNHPDQALLAFEAEPHGIDIVITDETMPELRGVDLARAMLQLRPKLPIILCTGYSEQVSAEIATGHGISAFMGKPIDIDALLRTVAERGFQMNSA
jgi:DNA-binding NtrC family response regulator